MGQIAMFILIGSTVSLITFWTMSKMVREGAFTELTVGMGHIAPDKLIVLLVMTAAVWRIMEMLYSWCESTVEAHFSAARQVELTKADIKFIIGAVEEYQQLVGDDAAQKRRAGLMIGHLDYYTQ